MSVCSIPTATSFGFELLRWLATLALNDGFVGTLSCADSSTDSPTLLFFFNHVDLNTVFSMDGYHKEMGVRAAVGLVFKQRFAKARHVTTSNWSQPRLTPQQMLYAANDAYAALKVLEALNLPREDLPIMGLAAQDVPPLLPE